MKQLLLLLLLLLLQLPANAEAVDFGKIRHWTGNGENRAALIVQFNDTEDHNAYVWGYRWPEGETRSGEQMFRDICANSSRLCLLTQFTGQYGSTVGGIGLSNNQEAIRHLRFDFDSANDDQRISFGYYEPNTLMGQTSAPADETPALVEEAVDAAAATHVIRHPLDQHTYGYPAYDYDYWQLDAGAPDSCLWRAGWYDGYWSYWVGTEGSDEMSYSGLGFSSNILEDGSIDGWSYVTDMNSWEGAPLDGKLIYLDADEQESSIDDINAEVPATEIYFDPAGRRVMSPRKGIFITNTGRKIILL